MNGYFRLLRRKLGNRYDNSLIWVRRGHCVSVSWLWGLGRASFVYFVAWHPNTRKGIGRSHNPTHQTPTHRPPNPTPQVLQISLNCLFALYPLVWTLTVDWDRWSLATEMSLFGTLDCAVKLVFTSVLSSLTSAAYDYDCMVRTYGCVRVHV